MSMLSLEPAVKWVYRSDKLFTSALIILQHPIVLIGMDIGNLLFIKHSDMRNLENDMHTAKKNNPSLQILFVVINKKGDPAYGNKRKRSTER